MTKYFGDISNADDIVSSWSLGDYVSDWYNFGHKKGVEPPPTDSEILAAYYAYEDYSGTAFVLFQRDDKLYEVNDGHCSCNGLEDWSPEETTWAALALRDFGGYSFHSDFTAFMQELIKSHV